MRSDARIFRAASPLGLGRCWLVEGSCWLCGQTQTGSVSPLASCSRHTHGRSGWPAGRPAWVCGLGAWLKPSAHLG